MFAAECLVLLLQRCQLLDCLVLSPDERIVGRLHGMDELIELEVHGQGIAALGVLDQKDHEEGDDGRPSVDDELPGFRETEKGPETAHTRMMATAARNVT